MRCVSYTRTVSCMENGEIPKDIIGQQNQRIQDYIKKRGWTLGKKYSDRKKDVYEETAYLQMKMDAIAREFDCVVLDSMFRCGRNSNVAAEMFRSMFVPAGVYFAVVEDDFCSCDVSEEETYKYLDEKAAAYRNKFTIDQVRKYNESKIYPKYGFKYKEGKMELEIDPEAAKHVRRIFELICEGHSCNETAKIMTADGIECSGNYVNKLWGRPIKDENAPWKMAQVKRIIYNRQYIGEWERTIDGKKKMFSCPVLIDKETFEKAHSKLSVRKYSDHVRGKTPLNPFSNRIFDKDSGIALKLYPHQRLKIRIFRLSYPKPKEIVYERGHIPFDEVYEKVHKIIENEKRQAERIAGMIGSFDWEYEKEIRILKIKAEAKLIFQKMLLIESRNLPLYNSMIAGKISEDEYAMQREVNIEEFEECDEKLQDYLEQIKEIEKCFSKDNLWIKTFSEMIVPEEITRKHVKAWIERIECVRYEEVEVQFKYQDWKERLPQKWFEGDFEDGTKE